jgi:uncharacterized protein (DUF427 family)
MKKAIFHGKVIAESSNTISLSGKTYFPHNSLKEQFFEESDSRSHNPQFGIANYYHLHMDNYLKQNAAYYHPAPLPHSKFIQNYVAFNDNDIEIKED